MDTPALAFSQVQNILHQKGNQNFCSLVLLQLDGAWYFVSYVSAKLVCREIAMTSEIKKGVMQ